jgi:predicted lipoprotein with Yx(FWY)xxD motif
LASGLTLADFSSITTPNGSQLTYKGWPLYYYAPNGVREQPGQTTGEGVFGLWFVAKTDYTIMLANGQLVGADGKNYVVSATNVYSEGTKSTKYFTDLAGRTLYSFSKDSANENKFTKADFSNNAVWPIYETDKVVVPSIFDKTLFGIIDVFGKKQLTYKGWPMFYFGADVDAATGKFRGNTKGVSVPTPGFWPVFNSALPAAPTK